MKMVLMIAAGGAMGAVARYGTVVAVGRLTGIGFPWGTVTVNLGFSLSQEMRGLIVVGFLGAYTTFSTFSLDAVTLMERGSWWPAFGYAAGSVIAGIALFFMGLRVWRLFA
jgi:CrcB protein